MTATLEVSPEERIPLGFLLAVEIGHLLHGTKEHVDAARGLSDVYTSLLDAPEGPVQIEFSSDELYLLGTRVFADASDLEEWWRDHRASLRATRQPAPFPDENFGKAAARFYPEVIESPDTWDFDHVRPLFGSLARKIDVAMIEFVPTARALYNKERAEINRRTLEMQRDRARRRARRYPALTDRETWRQAVRLDELGPGDMVDVAIEGRQILIANTGDGFYAIDAVCTHVPQLAMLANLSKGQLDMDRRCVTCPWHGAQFDLQSGRAIRQPYSKEFNREHFFAGRLTGVLDPKKTATDTRVYPIKVVGNYLMVNIG